LIEVQKEPGVSNFQVRFVILIGLIKTIAGATAIAGICFVHAIVAAICGAGAFGRRVSVANGVQALHSISPIGLIECITAAASSTCPASSVGDKPSRS
jgi:hypothetical protein